MSEHLATLTEAQEVAAARLVGDVGAWLQAQVTTLGQACVAQAREKSAQDAGLPASVRELDDHEVEALKAIRAGKTVEAELWARAAATARALPVSVEPAAPAVVSETPPAGPAV